MYLISLRRILCLVTKQINRTTMIKKIHFSLLLSLILPVAIFAMNSAEIATQLTAVQAAKKAAQRELRFAEKLLSTKVEKIAPALNDKNKAIIAKIIASPPFTKKAEESINSQVERIVKGSSFKDVKASHNLSEYFTAKVNTLLNDFFKAMADIKYCQML